MAGSRASSRAKGAARGPEPSASSEQCLTYLRQMKLIRHFEDKAGEAYSLGKVGGFCHLYIGQEAVAVGSMAALRSDDYITASYRDHGHALARGLTARSVMAELFGKATGCSHGKGGSMHLFDASLGFLGGHGIVGGHIPLTAGMAFAAKYRKTDQVAVCFFGEAAVNIGSFHETLNMAALWKLPAVFIVENNGYGMGTALARASSKLDLAHRAYSYEMTEEVVDGQDVFTVRSAVDRAVERARLESLPTLLEMRTYRYVGHSMSDAAHGTYRTKEEVEEFRQRDPIKLLEAHMVAAKMIDEAGLKALDEQVVAEVEDAVTFAEESPDPAPEALWTDVLAGGQ
ncbi:MAG: pyruvate dehydrogenase (acetyl-transferring) E1 component subunit alpha [Gemmatimonadales bacterium]|jgi:pyruvate dehydrogenase E1 component alpha subunit|nr:MAG: pyruvate dehydrogenase (acetyl-transferring) E1 component subunit alpha [Gemmatimonadales bacterium]